MATPTYDLIDSVTLSSSASSVTFSSIDQSYRDLIVVFDAAKNAASATTVEARFNDDTAANYSYVYAYGDGSNAYSGGGAGTFAFAGRIGASGNRGLNILQIMDYSATDKHKTSLNRASAPTSFVWMAASRWANTNAITKVALKPQADSFETGSTFYLYGVAS